MGHEISIRDYFQEDVVVGNSWEIENIYFKVNKLIKIVNTGQNHF